MVALTYAVLALVLLVVLPFSVGALPDERAWSSPALYLALASALLGAGLLLRELRRDLFQLCVFWVLVGAILALLSLAGVHEHPVIGWGGLVFTLSTWIASVGILVRGALAKDTTPIFRRFVAAQVFEVAGVQLAVECDAARDRLELRLWLQNCWDRERTVVPRLMSRQGWLGAPGGARFDDVGMRTLGPGEVVEWRLSGALTTPRAVSIFVALEVSGLDGRRVHRRRARSLPMRIPRLVTLLVAVASLGTAWVWGGGLRVKIPAGERTTSRR